MKTVIFVSRSLDYNSLRYRNLNTSSQVFEYGLASELNKIVNLRIIYLCSQKKYREVVSGFNFCSVNYRSLVGIFRFAKAIYDNKNAENFNIITTGYSTFELATIIFCSKIFGGKCFSYIYDTHLTATKKMPRCKRVIADCYFAMGFFLARKVSGLIVLNDNFIKKRKFSVRFLKTRVGTDLLVEQLVSDSPITKEKNSRKIIIFAGTINAENGVELLIETFSKNLTLNCELHFYGDGDLAKNVEIRAKIDSRFQYFGRISDISLQKKLRTADLLLNLRDPKCISSDYAFPSKLINFMATGTPVLSNRFPGLDESYINYLYIVDSFDADALGTKITELLKNGTDDLLGANAKKAVEKRHKWSTISSEVVKFIDEKLDN